MRNFILLLIVALLLIVVPAFAQTESSPSTVSYELPYPGLLPDNPLYSFKVLRDRIIGFVISDPLRKAEFDILQADKRLSVGVYLFAEGESKYELAEVTISKGENYFDDSIKSLSLSQKQGRNTSFILNKLKLSLQKHSEVIKDLASKSKGEIKQKLLKTNERVIKYQEQVK